MSRYTTSRGLNLLIYVLLKSQFWNEMCAKQTLASCDAGPKVTDVKESEDRNAVVVWSQGVYFIIPL